MPKFLRSKAVLIGIGAVAVLLIAYFVFRNNDTSPAGGLSEISSSAADALIGRDLLALLAQLKATKIDTSFFDNKTFESLEDFSREIDEQPIGRDNPFAPVGSTSTPPKVEVKAPPKTAPKATSTTPR